MKSRSLVVLAAVVLALLASTATASSILGFSKGPDNGLHVEVYLDLMSPESKTLYTMLKTKTELRLTGHILPMANHKFAWRAALGSMDAALSSQGANMDDAWWNFAGAVFGIQSSLAHAESFEKFDDALGAAWSQYDADSAASYDGQLTDVVEATLKSGIVSTPYVLIEGIPVEGTPAAVTAAINDFTKTGPSLPTTSKAVAIVPLFLIAICCVAGGFGVVKFIIPALDGNNARQFPAMNVPASAAQTPPTRFVDDVEDGDYSGEEGRFAAGLAPLDDEEL